MASGGVLALAVGVIRWFLAVEGVVVVVKKKADAKKADAFDELEARKKLLDLTLASLEYAEFDKRAPLIREARALISEISGTSGAAVPESVKGEGGQVVDFQKRLAKHRAGSPAAGRR